LGQELVKVLILLKSWLVSHGEELGLDGGNLSLSLWLVLDELLSNLDGLFA
jgi:hypothetical protein